MTVPKVSVIIPMYNAERFIRQTLISVLASKFTDYEVLVVDDCSTDSSVAQAEKLLAHFNGRLKIFSTQTNSGGAGVPRNVGMKNSSGKYIYFLDADDFILPTALGDLFDVAEKFQADVLHTEKFFAFNDRGESSFRREDLTLRREETGEAVTMPTFEPDDLRERIRRCIEGRFIWMSCGKFFRRDLLLENKIEFPNMPLAEDLIFTFKCLLCAKNYVRVPFATFIYRLHRSSASKRMATLQDGVKTWLSLITNGLSLIAKFMDEHALFGYPDTKHLALEFLVQSYFCFIEDFLKRLQPHELETIFFDEMQNPALSPHGKDILLAHMCTKRTLNRNA